MSKVIQTIKLKLHRGRKSFSDPFKFKQNTLPGEFDGRSSKTLGRPEFSKRCSRTFLTLDSKLTSACSNNSSSLGTYINKSKYTRVAGISSACIFIFLFALFLYPIIRNLNSAEAITPTDSTTTLTIASGASANVELLVRDANGTFAKSSSSEAVSFGVTTNNYAGYELSIAGSDNTYNNLVNSDTSTNLTSISSSMDESSFSSYSLTGNQGIWGYLPSKLNSSANTSYQPAPDTTGDTIEKTTTPNASTANSYTIGLGVKADYNTPAGTYTNTYVLTAVGNGTPYTITYADDSGDSTVSGLPDIQQSTEGVSTSTVELTTDTPTRTGYSFTSWCEGTVSDSGTTCTGTTYAPGASFGIDRTAASNASTLYAVWTINTYDLTLTFAGSGVENVKVCTVSGDCTGDDLIGTVSTSGDSVSGLAYNTTYYLYPTFSTNYELDSWEKTSTTGTLSSTSDSNPTFTIGAGNGAVTITGKSTMEYLQDFTSAECVAMATNETKTLGDSRDGQSYTIQRLADGNCWMMENLNLGATDLTTDLTSDNTNLSTTISASDWNGYEASSGSATYTVAEYIPLTTSNTSDGLDTDSTSGTAYGTLYNYCAASAGTICTNSNSSNASYDICPKGWRLPTGGSSGEFYTLYNNSSYNTNAKMRASVANGGAAFALAGIFYNSTPTNQGSYGYYWSSTRSSNTNMYYLSLNTSGVGPANNYYRYSGYSIRCVKDIPTLQDFSVSDASAMSTGETKTLYDSRDYQSYTVAKLADGNVWMTRNLAIGCNGSGSTYGSDVSSKTLTSTYSNVSSSYTTPTSSGHSQTYTEGNIVCNSTYGAWYNYYAATAGTISGNSNETDATYDICPKGWRLPTYSEQSGITSYSSAFSPVTGGYYYDGSLSNTGTGAWWSATAYDSSFRYRLRYSWSSLNTSFDARNFGFYVRCIKDMNGYMQDFTSSDADAMATGDTKTLVDSRDNQKYTVAKINGNVWMTRNLAIGCSGSSVSSKTLTSSDSNVSSSYTTPSSSGHSESTTAGKIVCSSTYGAWYNYAAASAMTITGNKNTNNATYDICPKGWRLPTNSEQSGITSYVDAFSPVTGGCYVSGSLSNTSSGYWYSGSAPSSTNGMYNRYRLIYYGGNLTHDASSGRTSGYYVRCIRSS